MICLVHRPSGIALTRLEENDHWTLSFPLEVRKTWLDRLEAFVIRMNRIGWECELRPMETPHGQIYFFNRKRSASYRSWTTDGYESFFNPHWGT